jgi:hypothetical protein
LKQHKPLAKMKKHVQANKKKTYAKAKAIHNKIKMQKNKKNKKAKWGPRELTYYAR